MGRNDQSVTAPVDVLAVLRRVSRHVPNEDFVEFDDALDAVAELVEAASNVGSASSQADWRRLAAALARFGGA